MKTVNIDEIQKQINIMNLENQTKFFIELKEFNQKLDSYIDNNEYENIIKTISDKGFLSCVTTLGITKERYIDLLLSYINNDDILKNNIINTHFKDFDRGIING